MTTSPVRIGLVGYGKGGRYFHAPLIDQAEGCLLAGVVVRSASRRADLAAERAGVPLTVYQNRRWDADFLTVRDVLRAGEVGEVVVCESRMEQFLPETGFPTTGGGVRLDLGSHAVDQLRCLFGPVESVYAETRVLPGHGLDDRFFAALRHRSGVSSHVLCSLTHQGEPGSRFRVVGTAATLVVEDDDGQTDRLLSGRTPADEAAGWGTVPESRWGRLHRGGVATPVPSATGSWSSFYSGLARALRDGAPLLVDPWDAVATLEVLDAALVSARTGQVVQLPEGAG
jgi:predicted dehydrogenase